MQPPVIVSEQIFSSCNSAKFDQKPAEIFARGIMATNSGIQLSRTPSYGKNRLVSHPTCFLRG